MMVSLASRRSTKTRALHGVTQVVANLITYLFEPAPDVVQILLKPLVVTAGQGILGCGQRGEARAQRPGPAPVIDVLSLSFRSRRRPRTGAYPLSRIMHWPSSLRIQSMYSLIAP